MTEINQDDINVASKVVSYAQAADSMNKFYQSGYKDALYIPLYDDQIIPLCDDCIMSTRGQVYKVGDKGRLETIGDSRVDLLVDDEDSDRETV